MKRPVIVNWEALKLRYFASKEMSAKTFVESMGVIYSGNTGDKIKGWREQKVEWLQGIIEQAKQQVESEFVVDISMLASSRWSIVRHLVNKIKAAEEPKVLIEIWKVLKTELGEPTSVNRNLNENWDMPVELSEEDKAKASKIMANVKKLAEAEKPVEAPKPEPKKPAETPKPPEKKPEGSK